MANDSENPGVALPDQSALDQIKNTLAQIYEIAQKLVASGVNGVGLFKGLKDSVANVAPEIKSLEEGAAEFFQNMVAGVSNSSDLLRQFSKDVTGLQDIQLLDPSKMQTDILNKFKEMREPFREAAKGMQDILAANRINIAEAIVFDMTAAGYEKLMAPVMAIEGKITQQIGEVSPAIANLGGGFEKAGLNADAFATRVQEALTKSARSAQQLGIDTTRAHDALNAFGSSGVDISEIFENMGRSMSASGMPMEGLTAAMRMASATGLEMGKIGAYVQQNIRQLGRSASDTGNLIAALSLAQQGTGLSMTTVSDTVMQSASTLKYYGTSVESLSNTFNAFISAVGHGREELGKELFSDTIKHLEQMNFGMKAFLGMQSGLGRGQGAIGAGLEIEQAMAEGRTGEIFAAIREQMERFGGGQILTRKEAIDTRQQQQYFMGRQYLSTITGETDAGKLDTIMGILQRGETERATEVFAEPGRLGARREQLFDTGQAKLDMETGVAQQGLNRLRAEESEAIGTMISSYAQAADSIRATSTKFIEILQSSGRAVAARLGLAPKEGGGADADAINKRMIENPQVAIATGATGVGGIAAEGPYTLGAGGIAVDARLGLSTASSVASDMMHPYPSMPTSRPSPSFGAPAFQLGEPRLPLPEGFLSPAIPPPLAPAATAPSGSTPSASAPAGGKSTSLMASALDLPISVSFTVDSSGLKAVFASINKDLITQVKAAVTA